MASLVTEKSLGDFLSKKALELMEYYKEVGYSSPKLCLIVDECNLRYENGGIFRESKWHGDFWKLSGEKRGEIWVFADGVFGVDFVGLDTLCKQTALYLKSIGIKKGEYVASITGNCLEFVLFYFALSYLGCIFIPLNPSFGKKEMEAIYDQTPFSHILVEESCSIEVPFTRRKDLLEKIDCFKDLQIFPIAELQDVAMVLYTSGTTGKPKGCLITHYNLLFASFFTSYQIGLRSGETFVSFMPCYHIDLQATALLPSLRANCPFVLLGRFSASRFWHQIVFFDARVSEVIPKVVCALLCQKTFERERMHHLRFLLYFLNMPMHRYREFCNRFQTEFFTSYGSSESIVGVIGDLYFHKKVFPALGKVFLGYEAIIARRENQRLIELPNNEIGEICIKGRRGYEIFLGYIDGNEDCFCDGYLMMGDMGYCDENGVFWFSARKKDVLKVNGENINSMEIEDVLNKHPLIRESAVVSCEGECGDELIAFVELLANPRIQNDFEHLKQELLELFRDFASFKIPRIIFIEELPRNAIGKVCKDRLKKEE